MFDFELLDNMVLNGQFTQNTNGAELTVTLAPRTFGVVVLTAGHCLDPHGSHVGHGHVSHTMVSFLQLAQMNFLGSLRASSTALMACCPSVVTW